MSTETVTVEHEPVSWRKILNPVWWLMNGDSWTAPETNNGTPYLPDVQNQFLRNFYWFWRNPLANFVGYVIGMDGRNYTVTGTAPVLLTTWADAVPPQTGWKWSLINGWLPFVSYAGRFVFYFGWRPASGGFGFKLVNGR